MMLMDIQRATNETCGKATGAVVVIDVLRAFSTASYALAAGARKIYLVSTVEEAFALKERFPDALMTGEVDGLPIEGFDYGNSPTQLVNENLAGRRLIQRTSAGTQGVTRSKQAGLLFASSLCVAGATARYLRRRNLAQITFVITGSHTRDRGDEDRACADYVECLLRGEFPPRETYIQRVRSAVAARKFLDPNETQYPLSDLDYCCKVDHFDFAMLVKREDGLFVLQPVTP